MPGCLYNGRLKTMEGYLIMGLTIFLFIIMAVIESSIVIPINPPLILYFLIYVCLSILTFLALKSTEFTNLPNSGKTLLKLYWLYSLIIVVYSMAVSHSYLDYKYIFISYIQAIFITFDSFLLENLVILFFNYFLFVVCKYLT